MANIKIGDTTYNSVGMLMTKEAEGDSYAWFKYYGSGEVSTDLPDGYTSLPKLKSVANSYVVTDYVGKLDTVVKAKVNYSQYVGAGKGTIFSDKSASGSSLRFESATSAVAYVHGQANNNITRQSIQAGNDMEVVAFKDNNKLVINGTEYSVNSGSLINTNVFYIGDVNLSLDGYIYYVQFLEGDAVIRNYVPCINDQNVVGFYETITGTFYASSGTAFTTD